MDPSEERPWDLCQASGCMERAARGVARGVIARSGMCWRCHYQDRQGAALRALEDKLWAADGKGDASEDRQTILAQPQDPRTILQQVIRPAGVVGANAGHVAPAMRKAGVTVAKQSGHTTAPLGDGEWATPCRCDTPHPHAGCPWLCGGCAGILRVPPEEAEAETCIRCNRAGPGLRWCRTS